MQALISRFGGTPALVLKIVLLALINGVAIWALPTLLTTKSWVMLAVLVVATLALDFIMLGKHYIPAKYVIPGAILLTVFQLIPIIFTVSIAFTNYSTGHIGTRESAIEQIEANSLTETENAAQYSLLLLRDNADELVVALTEIPVEATDTTAAATTDDVQTEFGGGDESGAVVEETSPSPEATSDIAVDVPLGDLPPTFIGTPNGLDPVDPADVQRDEFGTVVGIQGYTLVPEDEYPGLDQELAAIRIPGPNGGYIVPQGFVAALELAPIVVFDQAAQTFTNVETGVVYVDNGQGSFVNPDNADDMLLPGWQTGIGFQNFARIINDPDITGPFFRVFIWTFAFAFLTVLLTFAFGLGLAMALNKPGMKGQKIYRSLLIIPYAIPGFLSILVFRGLLNDDFGAINAALGLSIPWLYDPNWAKVSVLLVNLWLGVPYMFLVSTGALQSIPSELQEAARIDGARPLQVFRKVNLPLLLVALTPLLVASFAFNFNNFNVIYMLTAGGPAMDGSSVAGATDILISYTYKVAFAAGMGNDFGLASAISIIIFLIVGTISGISFARSKALREEQA